MRNVLFSGLVAGVAGGIPLGLLLSAIVPSDMGLPGRSLMELVAAAMGSKHVALAWIVMLGISALLGVIFSGLVRRAADAGTVASMALLSGVVLWAIVGTVVAPLLTGGRPLVGLTDMKVWPLVVGALMLSLLFWSVVAAVFLWHRHRRARAEVTGVRELRRAA
jgi:hypothetical protein